MLMKSIKAEWMKLRHSMIWSVLFVLPMISIGLGGINFWMNQQILQKEWYSLWTQVVLFYGYFFFPVLISILCSYLCRLEHLNHNWNAVMTSPIPIRNVFVSKLIVISMLTFIIHLFICILFIILGTLFGFKSHIPFELIGWFARGFCASIVISSLQLCLSMRIRSFAAPIGICMCASIAGIAAIAKGFGIYYPYSMLSIGMGAVTQKGLSIHDNITFAVMAFVFVSIFCIGGVSRLKKKDVIA